MLDEVTFRRAVAAAAVLAVATVALLVAPVDGQGGRPAALAVLSTLAAVMSVPAGVARFRRTGAWSWLFLAAAAGLWSAGQVGYTFWALTRPGIPMPFPHWSDVAFVLTAPLLAVGMLVLRTDVIPVTRVRRVVEAHIMALSLLFLSWALMLGPVFQRVSGDGLQLLFAAAYLSGGVLALSLAASFLARLSSGRRTMTWLTAGLVTLCVTDAVYVYRATAGTFEPGGGLDVAWTGAFLLLFLGTLAPRSAQRVERPVAPGGVMLALPLVPVLAVVVVAATMAARGEPFDVLLGVAAVGIAVLVLVRQFLTAFENRMLTRRLAERIEQLSEREHELRHQAFHDSLTGLANRALFLDRVEHALTLRSDRHLALLFIDIDDFKLVNDSLGHGAGDELIAAVAQRLHGTSRHGDTVARLGGDEFGILLEGLGSRHDAEVVAERILEAVRAPLTLGGVSINTRASIGVAYTQDAGSAGELLRNADVALYAAKGDGKGSWKVFASEMQEEVRDKLDLEAELERAVEAGEIDVVYQAMVHLRTGELAGFEALARWRHGRRGAISPMTFIGLAEEMGLIHRLGVAVLRRACEQAREWGDRHPDAPPWWMSVNLSARQLARPDLVDEVGAILDGTGLAPERLVLEITETSLLGDAEMALRCLGKLRALGVRLALDDFGTGYASLDYLRRLPVQLLKIDRIFVEAASTDPSSARLLQAVVNIGSTLGLETLAEGVEDDVQAEMLRAMGCDLAQGFRFSRPSGAADTARLLDRIEAEGWRLDTAEPAGRAVPVLSAHPSGP